MESSFAHAAMTETDWLTDADWTRHLEFVEPRLGPRRARLLAVALCELRLADAGDADMRAALGTIANFAEGDATRDELEAVRTWARAAAVKANDQIDPFDLESARLHSLRNEFAWAVAFAAQSPVSLKHVCTYTDRGADGPAMLGLVREVAGNPFRPVEFAPEWRTETVRALARRVYEVREFTAMPILADALQDAGCDDEQVLAHCRGDGVHVRGCWVLDGVLGKMNAPPMPLQ